MQKARHTVLLQDYARMGIDTLLIPNPQCPWRVRQPKRTREELLRIADTFAPLCVCLAGRKETEASAMRFSNSYDILDVCFANLCFAFKLRWDTTELRLREATPPLIADSSRDISVKLINSYFMLLHLLNISSQDSPVWLARSAIWTKSTSFAAHTQLSLYCHDECRIRRAWREKISIYNIWLYLHMSIMSGNIMIR